MSFPTQSAIGSKEFVDTALGIASVVDQDAIMRDIPDNAGVSHTILQRELSYVLVAYLLLTPHTALPSNASSLAGGFLPGSNLHESLHLCLR